MSYAVVDLETTTKAYKKRLGSPFHPDNWIVMMGWCTRNEPRPQGQRYMQYRQGDVDRDFINILRTPGLRWVVGHNVKFDILHLINGSEDVLEEWQKFVAGGGRVFCTQLAEYLLDGHDQQSHMLSLNELSARHGLDSKVDEVKELWAAGVDTPDIEPALLARYLLGEDLPNGLRREGDIGITRDHFLRQCEAIKGQNMTRLIALEMGALTASIEMERNGMFVDRVLGAKLAAELAAELAEAKQELEQYLPPDLPFTFNWSNRYHLSPAIFGGAIKYQRKQYDLKDGGTSYEKPAAGLGVYAQKEQQHYILEDGTTMEVLWWEHCYNTEHGFADDESNERVQFKAGKNAGEYKTKKVKVDDLDKPKCRMVDDFWKFNGVATPRKEWASATPGLYSVGADVIKDLTEHTTIPFLKTLGRVTSISKDLGTYFISEDGEKGMLTLVGDDGVVHHSVNHTNTVTGRLSGSNPNL